MVEREKLAQGRQKTARLGPSSGSAAVVVPNRNAAGRHSVVESVSVGPSGMYQARKYGTATEKRSRLSAVSEEPQEIFRRTVISDGNHSASLGVSAAVSQQGCRERPESVRLRSQGRHQTGRRVAAPRPPRKRAVLVGVNYLFAPDILLRGSSNDAAAIACALVNLCEFDPTQVVLLVDAYPSLAYRRYDRLEKNGPEDCQDVEEGQRPGDFVLWKDRQPTRRNILLALNWLRADSQPGDVLVFYFAGHGIQIDDMSGWEGEGYDEAILPMDFYGEEVNAITAVMIRNLLLSVAHDVQVTMILDCNGGQTMLDPSGTGGWTFIKGVKQRGVWPFVTDATDKVSRRVLRGGR